MNNTNNKIKISNRNIISKKMVIPGFVAFGLLSLVSCGNKIESNNQNSTQVVVSEDTNDNNQRVVELTNNTTEETKKEPKSLCNEEYNYYSTSYLNSLKDHKDDEFDEKFQELYSKDKYIVNGKEYDSKKLYLAEYEDGSKHLYESGIKTDILTGEDLNMKKTNFSSLKQSSLFYQLYLDGKIVDNQINIDSQAVSTWDGERHAETRALKADQEAKEAYRKKYGK